MSAHLPVIIARPGSVVWVVSPVAMRRSVYSGRSAVRRAASVNPMLSGALTEWSPAFGASWQVVHVPVNGSGTVTRLGNVWLFNPATPAITIGFVLKTSWPRAMARRAWGISRGPPDAFIQASNSVKARGSKRRPVGFNPTGSLIPMKNGSADKAIGPPFAPAARNCPASSLSACAVNSAVSNSTIACVSGSVRCRAAWACPVVASSACCARSCRIVVVGDDSRPSHITALRNRRFVAGSGRRYTESDVRGRLQSYGSSTSSIANSAPAGTSRPTLMRPRESRRLNARRRCCSVVMSASWQLDPSLLRKIGSSPFDSTKRRCTSSGVIVHP
jgi:hypothetical protein